MVVYPLSTAPTTTDIPICIQAHTTRTTVDHMGREKETHLVRFECGNCEMVATVIDTHTGRRAWADHMDTHSWSTNYRCWTWSVIELPLEN